jgi:hypothetical protein
VVLVHLLDLVASAHRVDSQAESKGKHREINNRKYFPWLEKSAKRKIAQI